MLESKRRYRYFHATSAAVLLLATAGEVAAWDEYDRKREAEAEAKKEPIGMGYALRFGPSMYRVPGGGSGGLLAEAELLNLTASGVGSGFSVGLGPSFGVSEIHLPIKVYLAFAEQHGFRISGHGMIMPVFSTAEGANGFFSGFGAHVAYDFDLARAETWSLDKRSTWGLGAFLDGSTLTPVLDDGPVPTGSWVGLFTTGLVARFH